MEMNLIQAGFVVSMFICISWLNIGLFIYLVAEPHNDATIKSSKKLRYTVAAVVCGLIYLLFFGVVYDTSRCV